MYGSSTIWKNCSRKAFESSEKNKNPISAPSRIFEEDEVYDEEAEACEEASGTEEPISGIEVEDYISRETLLELHTDNEVSEDEE